MGKIPRLSGKWTALLIAFAMVAAACGSSSDDTTTSTAVAGPAATTTTAAAPAATTTTADTGPRAFTAEELRDVDAIPGSGAGIKIGYISLGESIPFVKLVSDSLRDEAEAAGAEFVICDSEVLQEVALECARTLAVQNIDVLINFQLFEDAAAAICEEFPGIPVVSIDIHQRPCETTFFGADNQGAGFMTGASTGRHIEGSFNCEYDEFVILNALAAGEVVVIRGDAAVEGFESVCGPVPEDKFSLIDVPSIAVDEARENTADWLTTHPDAEVVALVSTNDDMLLGALAAFRIADREDAFWGTAQGADESAWVEIVCNEHWVGDTAYFPERYGRTAVPAAIALATGNTVPNPLTTSHFLLTDNPAILADSSIPTRAFTDFYTAPTCS